MLNSLGGLILQYQNRGGRSDFMGFKCLKCKKVIEEGDERVRCPYCGYRIFVKMRPEVIKRVQAR